jgi:VWFA-related protein
MAFLRGGLFISFLVATGLGAQQEGVLPSQSPGNAVATISVTARQVVLDVVVADSRRHPVKGLKQSDFILTEDGVPQTLASFTEHDAADEPPVPTLPVLPPNTFANHAPLVNDTAVTVLVFDTSGLPSADAARARDEVAAYVKKVAPGTPICIFDIDPWGLRLVQDFTTDPKVLRQAVESKNNAQKPYKLPPFVPNHLRLGPPLRQLAGYLASFPGRKNLVWFGGFTPPIAVAGRPGGLFPDLSSFNQADDSFVKDMQSMTATLTLNRVALYTVDPRGVVFDQDRNTLVSIVEGNPKVAAMASGETTFAGDSSDAVIQQGVDNAALTAQTGGKAFFNSNSIDRDVAEVVATGSHYYTVSYAPTNTNWDGSLRTIKVQLVNNGAAYLAGQRPAGQLVAPLHLEYRSGYYALAKAPRASAGGSGGTRQLISYSPKGDPKIPRPLRNIDRWTRRCRLGRLRRSRFFSVLTLLRLPPP